MKVAKYAILLVLTSCEYDTTNTPIVSPIIDAKCHIDTTQRPSYTFPERYSILKVKNGYKVMLPYGTLLDGEYATPQAAQRRINKVAAESYDRWVSSYGKDF